MRAIRAPENLFVEVLWKFNKWVLVGWPQGSQYRVGVKYLVLLQLRVIEDAPGCGQNGRAENPALSVTPDMQALRGLGGISGVYWSGSASKADKQCM